MRLFVFFLIFTIHVQCFAQQSFQTISRDIMKEMREYHIENIQKKIHLLKPKNEAEGKLLELFKWKRNYFIDGFDSNLKHNPVEEVDRSNSVNSTTEIISLLLYGDYLHLTTEDESLAYEYYLLAEKHALENKDALLICESIKRMKIILNNSNLKTELLLDRMPTYEKYAYDTYEYKLYKLLQLRTESKLIHKNKINEYLTEVEDSLMLQYPMLRASYYKMLGINYDHFKKDFKKAIDYFDKSLEIYNSKDLFIFEKNMFGILLDIGICYYQDNNHFLADYYFKEACEKKKYDSSNESHLILYDWNYKNLIALENKEEAFESLEEAYLLKDSIYKKNYDAQVANSDIKYKSAEKEKKLIEKNSQLIISLSILALVIISAYLLQKNTRKKQLLAEQAKDLEAQKVFTLLKEQELASIDAMIEGQEKERKRIAEDLHDDLGALMATVKLHFDNIETAQNEDAVQKTSSLLDEAYSKIRTIAHAKNAGVIANDGLLVAVKNMTSKISSANKVDMEVIAHGLENRLENSLELSLFRTIQELIANIIKHAEATKATIQLTQFQESLNIIVEDNGKGFDFKEIKETGIGLDNIKKRVEHLNGKLNIDSTLGKGTSIILDIPIK